MMLPIKLKNAFGFTLMEIMVSVGLMGTLIYVLAGGTGAVNKQTRNTKNQLTLTRNVGSIVDSVRTNVSLYKIDFKGELPTKVEDLPYSWNDKGMQIGCADCPGKIGWVLTPLSQDGQYRGLYKLVVRVSHKELVPTAPYYKDYIFLIKGK